MSQLLSFSDNLTAPAFAEQLARDGHVQIYNVLTPTSAAALADALKTETVWSRSISVGGIGRDVPVSMFESYSDADQQGFNEMVWGDARDGFQYLFDRFRVSDIAAAGGALPPTLAAINALLNAPTSLASFRALTGDPEIALLDAQATRYLLGHFLNQHDDQRADHGRRYAYVLNMSETWRADWGGLLLFYDHNRVKSGLLPLYNTLNVFAVPRWHSVSIVTPFAGAPRLAITGWMRKYGP